MQGDLIVQKGEAGSEFFIVSRGTVAIEKDVDAGIHEEIQMSEGSFFGEIALLLHQPRTCSVKSVTITEICILTRHVFEQVLTEFDGFEKEIVDLIHARIRKNSLKGSIAPRRASMDTKLFQELGHIRQEYAGKESLSATKVLSQEPNLPGSNRSRVKPILTSRASSSSLCNDSLRLENIERCMQLMLDHQGIERRSSTVGEMNVVYER